MAKYLIETRVTQRRGYYVEATDQKDALAKYGNAPADYEEDDDEETMSITELVETTPDGARDA